MCVVVVVFLFFFTSQPVNEKLTEKRLNVFQRSPSINASLDARVGHILTVIFITVTFHMVDRQTEYITRVDYT